MLPIVDHNFAGMEWILNQYSYKPFVVIEESDEFLIIGMN